MKNLGILTEKESVTFTENNLSEVEMTLKKYKNRTSINATTERMKNLVTLLAVSIPFHMTIQYKNLIS